LIEGKDERHDGDDYHRLAAWPDAPRQPARIAALQHQRSPMPLPPPPAARALAHTRRLRFEGYKRADGLWDLEAHLTDIKPLDFPLASGVRAAGTPIHDMWIRLTFDRRLDVVDAAVAIDAMPYPGACGTIAPDYARRLVGLNLARAFARAVRERFANLAGCTHLSEMLTQFPTAAIQALAGEKRDVDSEADGTKPFQLDRCHALDTRGDAVRRYYPRWYRDGADTREAVRAEEKR